MSKLVAGWSIPEASDKGCAMTVEQLAEYGLKLEFAKGSNSYVLGA
ncbi:MAG: hypothetical protein PHR45_03195 [Muribaculaceae bacterium]|nr:hypothetical protein [Muribaculaceae bacterium]